MPRGLYTEHDDQVLRLLQHGPHTPYRIGKYLCIGPDAARVILKRLKWQGKVEWRDNHESARLKTKNAVADTSPFPRPSWETPKVGWLG